MMTYKELYYFTGHCLALDENPGFRETILQKILANDIYWESFVQLCSDHLIIPVIYLKFKTHDLLSFLPEELVQTLTEIYELNRERNARILLQIETIRTALWAEKVEPVFLKGTANLLDGLYSDLGERMIGDIDFLVSEENYLRTAAMMEGMGYQQMLENYQDVSGSKHYPRLLHPGFIAGIEIHRIPVNEEYSGSFNSELVFRYQIPVSGKPGIYVPTDAHKVIHTFIHSQLSDKGYSYKQTSFRTINDLYLLSKRIDVSTLAYQTSYGNKFIAWRAFCQRVLGLQGRLCPVETKAARWFCLKYNLALTFVNSYKVYTFIKKLIYLIFARYLGGFLKAIFQKRQRLSVYSRMKNPNWYRAHLKSYKVYFS